MKKEDILKINNSKEILETLKKHPHLVDEEIGNYINNVIKKEFKSLYPNTEKGTLVDPF